MPPAFVKNPLHKSMLPDTASAWTYATRLPALRPEPSADQFVPFHWAMRLAGTPPAFVK